MKTYTIEASYNTGSHGKVTFPEGKSWDDVSDWYVKWDTLHVQWKGAQENEAFELNSDNTDGTDWKRPLHVTVFGRDAADETDHDEIMAES